MIQAKGYERIAEAEARDNRLIQDLIDFGTSTMLTHLEEDRLIKDCQSYELYEDYTVFRLTTGDKTYYKFQVEATNDVKTVKATVLVMSYTRTRQEFLEDYRYEIVKCSKRRS